MDLLLQQLVDGVAAGAIYGALALALVLVYRASHTINFAQGEMALLGAYLSWQFFAFGLPLLAALAVSVLACAVLGMGIERVLIRPLAKRNQHLPMIITTLGLMIALNAVIAWVWGHQTREVPPVLGQGAVEVAGAALSRQDLVIIATVLGGAIALAAFFRFTRTGLFMRATVGDPESARLSGVRTGRMLSVGWGLAGGIGAIAGTLIAPELFLQPGMMAPVLIYAFAAATLGGLDSPLGAIVGGIIVGLAENIAGTYVPWIGSEFKQGLALAIILVVLLLRPAGLFGSRKVVRV